MSVFRKDSTSKTAGGKSYVDPNALITTEEWYIINDIIGSIYKSHDSVHARRVVLDRVGEIIPYTKGSFMLASLKEGTLNYFDPVLVHESIDNIQDYLDKYQHLDPMIAFFAQSDESVYIDSEYITESMAKASVLYQNWFHPNGMHYMLGAKLVYNDVLLGSMLLCRDRDCADFTPRDKELIRIIGEHLSYKIYTFYPSGVTKQTIEAGGDFLSVKYGLSYREIEVVELLCKGATTKAVAESLCISENTVKRHAGNIYKKMGISGKPQLIALMSMENKSHRTG